MHASQTSGLRKLHLALDVVAILASMGLAVLVQQRMQTLLSFVKDLPLFSDYAGLAYLALPLWLVLIVAFDLHTTFERPRPPGALLADLAKLHLVAFVAISVVQFTTQATVNRSLVLAFMSSTFCLMYLQRALLHGWVRYQHRRGQNRMRVLLVGQPTQRMAAFARDAANAPLPPELVGYLRPRLMDGSLSIPPPDAPDMPPCIGPVSDLPAILHNQPVDHVMFFPPCNRPEDLKQELRACEDLGVAASFSVSLVQLAQASPRVTSAFEHPFVTFDVAPKRAETLAIKHGLDPILAAVAIILLSPVMLVVVLLILATMGAPLLFVQERAGLYGRPFRMYKFRSMCRGAEAQREALSSQNEMGGPVFKVDRDPRVTPLGRLLRRTSLDELPQLFNVLSGSMSLVGPRPLPLSEQQQIQGWQRRRLSMKPGITCLWQIGGRNDLEFDEWMLLDLQYIDEWSLGLDLTILLRTLPAVLSRRGAK